MNQELDDALWYRTSVLVECPECNDTTLTQSLDILDKTIHHMWKLFGEYSNQFGTEDDYKKALATAGIMNQKDKILKLFKENGIIKIMCRTCLTNFQYKAMLDRGDSIVRKGNMLIGTSFYSKNRKSLDKEIRESGLDKVTFWT